MDISSSTTAHAVCRRLAEKGDRLPGPWLIDREGNPSDDARELFNDRGGALLPLGGMDLGYKGFALALLVEALTNALGGHGRADGETRWGASVFLQIINPDCFGGRESFLRETSFLAQSCIETPTPTGKPPVRLPGQAALAKRANQLAHGTELYPAIMPALIPWAEKLKVKLPSVI
jgi:L-lactate dehydrogenase